MGNTTSIPPPLVEVSAPGGKVLVPPHTAFTVHPPHYGRSGGQGPVYTPIRPWRSRREHPDLEFLEDDSEMDFNGMDMGGRGMGGGYPGRMPPGLDGGRRRDSMDRRGGLNRPDMMGGAGYPGMRPHSPRADMPYNPLRGARPDGFRPGPMGGLRTPGAMGMTPPPGYSPMPSPMAPQFGVDREHGGGPGPSGPNLYGYHNRPLSPMSVASTQSKADGYRPHRYTPGSHERVPMGLFTKPKTTPKAKPTGAEKLSRTQTKRSNVGPSGKAWIPGDDFLDQCTCTTNCTCRAGQRVLYRSKDSPYPDGSDGENAAKYAQGEIRYILKKDLGRDCGDHSKCRPKKSRSPSSSSSSSSSSDTEREAKREKGRKTKKKGENREKGFQDMKEELLEAFDERLDALKKANSSKAGSVSSPKMPFGGLHPVVQNPFGIGGLRMNPEMAMNLSNGRNPYAMGMKHEDNVSMTGMEGAGNPYVAGTKDGMRRTGFAPRGRRYSSTSDGPGIDLRAQHARRYKTGRGRDMSRGKWPDSGGSNDDGDSPFRGYRRSKSPRNGRAGRGRDDNQAHADTDDDAY